uniref:Pyrokinin-1 receptor-like n=1 Tax=Diabrotica virgifera virgifera TaxID=50390 RepID=A0A6P7F400_DIAVI
MQSSFYRHREDPLENATEIVPLQQLFLNQTYDWGPKRDPLYVVIPISVIYIAIFLTGILGNVSTCIVIARNKCMHTATNYYLFSLAISDLLLLVSGLPQEVYFIWSKYPYIFGEIFCVLQFQLLSMQMSGLQGVNTSWSGYINASRIWSNSQICNIAKNEFRRSNAIMLGDEGYGVVE